MSSVLTASAGRYRFVVNHVVLINIMDVSSC